MYVRAKVYKLEQCKMQTADRLRTIVFRVRKQWDYCCHVLIGMVKSTVCNLPFTLTVYKFLLSASVDGLSKVTVIP